MSSGIHALPKESTAELIAMRLRQAILDGKLVPGGRLKEQELAEQFEISRGPIREAIRILGTESLVDLRKNCGAIVNMPTMEDVLEVYAIRMSLGAIAINHLARRALTGNVELEFLDALLAKISSAITRKSNVRIIKADLEFQNQLIALSGLPRINEAMGKSAVDIRFFVSALKINYDDVDHKNLHGRHTRLLSNIKRGDATGSVKNWQEHIRKSVAEIIVGNSSSDLDAFFKHP